MAKHYCDCGRLIRVRMRKRWGPPPDKDHDQCNRCWKKNF